MSHLIKSLKISNFKSCKGTDIQLDKYTALVGYNNAGKSNILAAIEWLVKKSSLKDSDYNVLDQPVTVEATITGITDDLLGNMAQAQRSSLEPYVENAELRIRRVQQTPNASVRSINIEVFHQESQSWTANPNGIDATLKSILPEPIRIGAMENAEEDISKSKATTTIGKLLSEFSGGIIETHEDEFGRHFQAINNKVSHDGENRLQELNTIDESLNIKVGEFFPGISIKLHFEAPELSDLIKSGTVKVFEDGGDARDFSSYGHGSQRAIQMALVRYLSDIKRENNVNNHTTLLLIDEPELYLHPLAIEQIRQSLLSLSESGYQVIISTHSAQLVTAEHAEKTLLIRKDIELGTISRLRMVDAVHNVVNNAEHQIEMLFSLSNSTQILFSESVILTEGKTEKRLLPFFVEKETGTTLAQKKTSLIQQGGVDNTKKCMDILAAMDIPTKVIVDLDYAFRGAVSHGFLDEQDSDILALKEIMSQLENSNEITLSQNGLPQRGIVSASRAYELLAETSDAQTYIERLHQKLLQENIWLWKRGAIEAHLGSVSKSEASWANFKIQVESTGLESASTDYESLRELIAWLN